MSQIPIPIGTAFFSTKKSNRKKLPIVKEVVLAKQKGKSNQNVNEDLKMNGGDIDLWFVLKPVDGL
ncbi:MAG: hypothetical protein JWM28_853 [Chitinophagaceae bacterium]|nr:hypothetical protein [Chitinophagaceae bacterium]